MLNLSRTRLPRVRRFEYLMVYLESVHLGLSRKETALKIAEKKKYFEFQKLQALARGRSFSKNLAVTEYLEAECRKLALDLNFASMGNGKVEISRIGIDFLENKYDVKKQDFCKRYVETYGLAERFLEYFTADKRAEYKLPMKKDNKAFKEVAEQQGILLDQMNFEILRDMFRFFGLVNWFPFISETRRLHNVYSTLCICNSDERNCSKTPMLQFRGKMHCPRSVDRDKLRAVVWQEYLGLANYVPRRAVLYSDLRDRTCYSLHIPDEVFDKNVKAMLNDDDPELLIVGSKGSIPFSPSLFTFLKSVPPEIDGKFLVYLKMDRKKNDENILKI